MTSREEFDTKPNVGQGSVQHHHTYQPPPAHYDRRLGRVVIRLNSGLDVAFSPRDAQGLENATAVATRRDRD